MNKFILDTGVLLHYVSKSLLDSDFAGLYGVETSQLKQAVRRIYALKRNNIL